MSIYTPPEADLQFARDVLSKCDDEFLPHYLIGVIRSLLGMSEDPAKRRTPEEMVRACRAAILAYDERRDQ